MVKPPIVLTDREFFKKQVEEYKTKARFAPFCIGFYHMSGTIGKRRAKRTSHLLDYASDEGVNFIIYILSTLSAKTLNGFLQNNDRARNAVNAIQAKLTEPTFKENQNLTLAVKVFTDFLNVINYPSLQFKDLINCICKEFSFTELQNDNSTLVKDIKQLAREMSSELSFQTIKTMHMR